MAEGDMRIASWAAPAAAAFLAAVAIVGGSSAYVQSQVSNRDHQISVIEARVTGLETHVTDQDGWREEQRRQNKAIYDVLQEMEKQLSDIRVGLANKMDRKP